MMIGPRAPASWATAPDIRRFSEPGYKNRYLYLKTLKNENQKVCLSFGGLTSTRRWSRAPPSTHDDPYAEPTLAGRCRILADGPSRVTDDSDHPEVRGKASRPGAATVGPKAFHLARCRHLLDGGRGDRATDPLPGDSGTRARVADPDGAELDVGLRVVRLELDRAGFGTEAPAWVLIRRPVIDPVGHLVAVDPGGQVPTAGDHRQREG